MDAPCHYLSDFKHGNGHFLGNVDYLFIGNFLAIKRIAEWSKAQHSADRVE